MSEHDAQPTEWVESPEASAVGGEPAHSTHDAARRSRRDELNAVRAAMETWEQLTVDQRGAAAMLGVTVTKLRRWLLAGRGPRSFRDGDGPDGRVRFDVREIRDYLADPDAYEARRRDT